MSYTNAPNVAPSWASTRGQWSDNEWKEGWNVRKYLQKTLEYNLLEYNLIKIKV